jgi:hypothetical protein
MIKKFFLTSILVFWATGSLFMVSQFYGWHMMSFSALPSLAQSQGGQWTLTHVVSESCKCSAKVVEYLLTRGPEKDANEEILVIGHPPQITELHQRGFKTRALDPDDLKEDISKLGVPFLLITTPKGDTVYAGGYSEKSVQDGSPIRDLEILRSLQGSGNVANFPIFGCAVSRKLQKIVDPFSMKYTGQVKDEL